MNMNFLTLMICVLICVMEVFNHDKRGCYEKFILFISREIIFPDWSFLGYGSILE